MADEINYSVTLQINAGPLRERTDPTNWRGDMPVRGGPTPGEITVTPAGVDVDLSALIKPGVAWMINLDLTNKVSWGVRDAETGKYYPLGKLPPSESDGNAWPQPIYFDDDLFEEFGQTGTGTSGPGTNFLHLRAYNQNCRVVIKAFEGADEE